MEMVYSALFNYFIASPAAQPAQPCESDKLTDEREHTQKKYGIGTNRATGPTGRHNTYQYRMQVNAIHVIPFNFI